MSGFYRPNPNNVEKIGNKEDKDCPVIINYESTYNHPTFFGVPRDEQLIEEASMEGILNGRKISEVYQQDTKELEEAGYTWDEAVHILNCLAVACAYQDKKLSEYQDRLMKELWGTTSISNASKSQEEEYDRRYRQDLAMNAQLVGFKNIKVYSTSSKVRFDNPIEGDDVQYEPKTSLELVAKEAPERDVVLTTDREKITTTVNYQTLCQTVFYHLLEKGNRYAFTGRELAELIKSFDEADFNKQYGPFVEEEAKIIKADRETVPGHTEKVEFSDNIKLKLKIGRKGAHIFLNYSDRHAFFNFIMDDDDRDSNIDLRTSDKLISLVKNDDNKDWSAEIFDEKTLKSVKAETLPDNSFLLKFIDLAKRITQKTKIQPDKILDQDTAQELYKLFKELLRNY